ncbi:hypothetical protein [Arthrobacter sp. UYCo732]|uniref:hypothetical protein n=1 Tax=Arthrobacter sp. UYCo732 TaxID=3156336 RepID=UPI0033928C12
MAETTTLPCAVCRTPQEQMDGQPDVPYGANIFTSHGHHGATAFDSPGGEYLELLICTPCMKIMKANSAIHRVLDGTQAIPGQRNFWESEADPQEDNPWNKQRLRNEFAMEHFCESTEGMTQEWAGQIYEACQIASRTGKTFDPASISAPGRQDEGRIVAAAQAKVDFYDDLRGHGSEWTEIEFAEAQAALKSADAWDTANGIRRVGGHD